MKCVLKKLTLGLVLLVAVMVFAAGVWAADQKELDDVYQGKLTPQWKACDTDKECTAAIVCCYRWAAVNKNYSRSVAQAFRGCMKCIDPGFQPVTACVRNKCVATNQKTRITMADWLKPEYSKLTEEDCRQETGEDKDWCYMDLAEQDKSVYYCNYYEGWSAAKECIYYVDRAQKLKEGDCNVLTTFKDRCIQYVNSGIPSKPGQSYEKSQEYEK